MSAIEELKAAIDKLERRVKSVLGLMEVGADTNELYGRVESDHDENGDLTAYGLNLTGIDSDEEINEAIVTLHRTVDAQLAILRHTANFYSGDLGISTNRHVVELARSINGGTQ
jgi:hypothetical protein